MKFDQEKTPTILIVDDEKINIDYIVNSLNENFNIKATTNSNVVFNILEKNKIDMILLDIQMPNKSGFEIAKELKNNENFKDIPFIFLTSKTDTDSMVQGFDLGAVDYITKPFNLKELKARINTHAKNFILQEKVKDQQKELLIQSKFATMGEMTTMLAHQWRQPLNIISLLVQEIDLDKKMNFFTEDEYKKKKSLLLSTITDLSATIDRFSKFFNKDIKKDNTNLYELTNHVKSAFKEILHEYKIDLNINIKNNLEIDKFNILIPKKDFEQVLINIIQNSIDSLNQKEENKKTINISFNKINDEIIIEIIDNGIGIADKIKDIMFEPYTTTKNDLNGAGLGLYTSRMIIENHLKGTIKAQNQEQATGACITLKIKNDEI